MLGVTCGHTRDAACRLNELTELETFRLPKHPDEDGQSRVLFNLDRQFVRCASETARLRSGRMLRTSVRSGEARTSYQRV